MYFVSVIRAKHPLLMGQGLPVFGNRDQCLRESLGST